MRRFSNPSKDQLLGLYAELVEEAKETEPSNRLVVLEMAEPVRRALLRRVRWTARSTRS